MSNGHRWLKFWPQDWQGDDALRQCSLPARALWMELLCIAHKAMQRGAVLINGQQPTAKKIAVSAACTEREVTKYLAELEREGVFSRDPDGTIYSRRMRKDLEASEAGRGHASKRWGEGNGATTDPPNGAHQPNGPPNGVATRKPNGAATSYPTSYPNTLEAEADSETEPDKEESKVSIYNYSLSFPESRAREAPSGSDGTQIPLGAMSYDERHDVPTLDDIRKNREAFARDNAAAVVTGAGVRRVASALSLSRMPTPQRSKWQQIAAVTEPARPTTASSYAVPTRTPEQQLAELLGIPVTEAAARFTAHAA